MRLQGKSAIVTGGASGFGAGIARKFVSEGAKVIIADINEELAKSFAKELGPAAQAVSTDVSNASSVESLIQFACKANGSIDIVVNNAGVTHLPGPMEEIAESEFDRIISVNAKSVFLMAKYVVPVFRSQSHGCILNIASTAGVSPRPGLSWYNASKGWMITATRSMAVELASSAIRVNAINPVAGETPLLKSFMGEDTPETRARFLATIPIGRFSTPEDIANAACYLCSDEASMVTGACLEVDGGRCI
ncbi:MAG: SDR family oxidoreductase [Granulosicoccus sp.]|nr:SDR family oxidoreductase [Granulosicoccus sp.]